MHLGVQCARRARQARLLPMARLLPGRHVQRVPGGVRAMGPVRKDCAAPENTPPKEVQSVKLAIRINSTALLVRVRVQRAPRGRSRAGVL